jgi:hypothetical protein
MTKILYVADVHGSNICYKKFLNALKLYEVDAGILMGDLCGKMINPIVKRSDGTYLATVLGQNIIASTEEDLVKIEKNIATMGNYSFRTTQEEMAILKAEGKSVQGRIDERAANIRLSDGKIDDLFKKLVLERMEYWMELAEERISGSGIEVYMGAGNDDIMELDDIIRQSPVMIHADGNKVTIKDEFEMISSSWSNPTPWDTERECPEEELEQKLEVLASQLENPSTSIFNFHVPPYDTLIDQAPKLSEDLVPSTDETIPAGSKAVSNIITKYQPMLSLHGHIHESRGIVKIGKTSCLNPGSEYSEGILRGVILMLNKGKMKDFMFISG